jgi:hypothetical protein
MRVSHSLTPHAPQTNPCSRREPPRSSAAKKNWPAAGVRAHPLPAGRRDRRYHANDNIADFVREGELAELKAEVQAKMQECCRRW